MKAPGSKGTEDVNARITWIIFGWGCNFFLPRTGFLCKSIGNTDYSSLLVRSDSSQTHLSHFWNYFSLIWPILPTKGFQSSVQTHLFCSENLIQDSIKATQYRLQDSTLSKYSNIHILKMIWLERTLTATSLPSRPISEPTPQPGVSHIDAEHPQPEWVHHSSGQAPALSPEFRIYSGASRSKVNRHQGSASCWHTSGGYTDQDFICGRQKDSVVTGFPYTQWPNTKYRHLTCAANEALLQTLTYNMQPFSLFKPY